MKKRGEDQSWPKLLLFGAGKPDTHKAFLCKGIPRATPSADELLVGVLRSTTNRTGASFTRAPGQSRKPRSEWMRNKARVVPFSCVGTQLVLTHCEFSC